MEFLAKPNNNNIPHKIVIHKEQQKLRVLLLTLSPKGITIKLPINSETPNNTPFIYILERPSLYGIRTDKPYPIYKWDAKIQTPINFNVLVLLVNNIT